MPGGIELVTYDRPARHRLLGQGKLQGVVPHVVDEACDGIGQRAGQYRRGDHDQGYASQHQQGCRPALAIAQSCRQTLVSGIEGHGQDQGPQHQGQERREDPVADDNQGQDQSRLDKYIQQLVKQAAFQFRVGIVLHSGLSRWK